ncbi:MAG: aminoglycoside adenylyltransferase domain-containing protein [Acidimicrobiia bacterium]
MTGIGDSGVPSAVMAYCLGLVASLRALLDHALSALYVYGSAAVGDFHPQSSDLDILVVVSRSLSGPEKSGLIRMLWDTAPAVPAKGMECYVVTEQMVASGGTVRDYELIVNTHPQEPITLDGAAHRGEAPMVEVELARVTGATVFGTPANELIAPFPQSAVQASMVANLKKGMDDAAPEHYLVLNAARSLCYLSTGEHVSKLEGGRWLLAQGSATEVVGQALRAAMGNARQRSLTTSGRRFVEKTIEDLER